MARPRVPGTALVDAIQLERKPELIETLVGDDDHHPLTPPIWRNAYRAAIRHGQHAAAGILRSRGADESAVTDTDRLIAAAVIDDPAEVRRLLGLSSNLRPTLTIDDHRMLAWVIRTRRYHATPLLLEAGFDPNVADRDGETPLHLAVRANSMDITNALLTAGARVEARNFEAETPLDVAVALPDEKHRGDLIKRLLSAGARPAQENTTLDREEMNALFELAADAVAFGELDTLTELLDDEPSLVHARSPRPHRATLLHYCGANGTEDPRQRTPPNAPAIAQLLLDRGADVNATSNFYGGGATTLGLVLTSIHPVRAGVRLALMETLTKAGAWEGILAAAALGDLDRVRKSFESTFAAPSKTDVQSAFVWACQFGRTSVAEFLLEYGADIALQDGNGMTGLHVAAGGGHLDTVKLLIRRGAPLELKNVWGGTVLESILWHALNYDPNVDYAPIVEAVLEAGAHVESEVGTWWAENTPLFPSSKERIAESLRRYVAIEDRDQGPSSD
jgi:ankyrin repeat protein